MSKLNIIHPFREGNGRTIREFIRGLALSAGLEMNWALVDSQDLLNSVIIAANGNLKPLEKCLNQAIVKK
jgi:cell filamentation protein